MKAEFKSLKREYFEEYYYVVTNLKKFVKKPSRKLLRVSQGLLIYVIAAFIFFTLTAVFSLFDDQLRGFIVLPASAFIIIVISYLATLRKLRKLGNAKYTLTFSSTKKTANIALDNDDKLALDWKNIQKIIIGEHAIIFIPKTIEFTPLAIPKSGLKKLKETLREYKLTDFLPVRRPK